MMSMSRAREDGYGRGAHRIERNGYPQFASHRSGRSRFPPLPLPGLSPPQQGQPRPSHLILRVRPPNRVGGVGHAGESILALLAVLLANRRVRTLEHRLQPGLGGNPRVHRVYRVLSQNGVCRSTRMSVRFPSRSREERCGKLTGQKRQKILGMHAARKKRPPRWLAASSRAHNPPALRVRRSK